MYQQVNMCWVCKELVNNDSKIYVTFGNLDTICHKSCAHKILKLINALRQVREATKELPPDVASFVTSNENKVQAEEKEMIE